MAGIAGPGIEDELCAQVSEAASQGGRLQIVGGASRQFYGESSEGKPIEVSSHTGIIDYDPAELVISLRAGCKVREVEALLAEHGQMFAFEPPSYNEKATIGGMVASGLAGPRRAFSGSIRDFVLGVKLINGRGEVLQFGGRVIKNVAGFDLSRVMVGALGTLGLILEVSIRLVPVSETEITLIFEHGSADEHIRWINELGSEPLPVTASQWYDGKSYLRLTGSKQGVEHARTRLGGDEIAPCWDALARQDSGFFEQGQALSRISLPPATPDLALDRPCLLEWGGAQRWLCGDVDINKLRQQLQALGGTLCAFRDHAAGVPVFHPLPAAMLQLQRNIKSRFDPDGVFNPGKMYPGI